MNLRSLSKKAWSRFQKTFTAKELFFELVFKKLAFLMIVFYKSASFLQKGACRHRPTCSDYALECLEKFNLLKALRLTLLRLVSCRPLSKKPFYDPVP